MRVNSASTSVSVSPDAASAARRISSGVRTNTSARQSPTGDQVSSAGKSQSVRGWDHHPACDRDTALHHATLPHPMGSRDSWGCDLRCSQINPNGMMRERQSVCIASKAVLKPPQSRRYRACAFTAAFLSLGHTPQKAAHHPSVRPCTGRVRRSATNTT